MSQIFRRFPGMRHLAMAAGLTTYLLGPRHPQAGPEEVVLLSPHRPRRARRSRWFRWRRRVRHTGAPHRTETPP